LRIPIYIDNDVNTLTVSERWLGSGLLVDNFLVITVGRGIGLGIVLNGQIYRGKSGGAGEFGHIVVNPNGPLCSCGKRGCLESYLGDRALLAAARQEVSPDIRDIDDLVSRAGNGEAGAVKVLSRAGALLGQQVANLVNIFDPKLIIISGEGIRMGEVFFNTLRIAFHEYVMPGLAEDTEIRIAAWGNDVWARGAASLVIGELFISPIQKEG
jgi:predicted NBD/HSP70 family sugar kinase